MTATLNQDDSITLTWTAPDDGSVTGYHVLLRRPKEGEETLIVCASEMGTTATADTDTETDLDTRYGYHVKAKNTPCRSDVSNFARTTPDSSPGTPLAPPCATPTVHTDRRNSTLKNAAHHLGVRDAQALLTLYRPPDCRRRYAEGPGDAPLADSAGHHLDGRGLLLLGQPARSTQLLAVRLRLL